MIPILSVFNPSPVVVIYIIFVIVPWSLILDILIRASFVFPLIVVIIIHFMNTMSGSRASSDNLEASTDMGSATNDGPSPEAIQQLFDACDLDGNGYIEWEELEMVCENLDRDELEHIFEALDGDGDGRISITDFTEGFHSVSEALLSVSRRRRRQQYLQDYDSEEFEVFLQQLGPDFDLVSCQDQICELYQQLHSSEVPQTLRQYESVIYDVIKDLRQYQSEVDRLEKSLKRTNESNTEHLQQLEYEMEVQMTRTEQRVRKEERERIESEKAEIQRQLEAEIRELKSNLNQIHNAEDKVDRIDKPREDLLHSLKQDLEQLRSENRSLRSSLTEAQTNLVLSRSELVTLKSDFEEQNGFISNNRDVIQDYIGEQENLTRQLQLLHEANKKLQDTNDDLRAALENVSRSSRMSPRTTRLLSSASYMNDYVDDDVIIDQSRQRKSYASQGSYDGSEVQMSGGRRQFAYHTTDGDNYPDDGALIQQSGARKLLEEFLDSGNSTLRDPNELDSETEDDIRRAPPLREEIAVSMKQELKDAHRQQASHQRATHATSTQHSTNPRGATSASLHTSNYGEPIRDMRSLSRGSSPRSSGGGSRKRALPQLPQQVTSVVNNLMEYFENEPLSPTPTAQPERMYKIVLAGDAAVGKSSFIMRLCKGIFHSNLNSTLGVDFQMKTIDVDDRVTSLQLWDTAGQERFRSIAKSYFRRADGVLLLYDCTCERSFINVRDWIEAIEEGSHKPVPVMICANKLDARPLAMAEGVRCVRTEDGQRLATSFNALFIETSAKEGSNVEDAVIELTRQLHKREDLEVSSSGITLNKETPAKKKESGCCDF
ncbi:ras and EF-hand domain-containing protein homolog isoform X4 [Lytechinus variegatus]|uniref:ras and EF-hand domain-containing protein homolog isoform X4 n=1 Tax=Lytechinus variegatus TaxID=7654 RepID=UPI001BB1E494|nr:ras and EF-hand domain-containing protein homolog isoform X4 [Lytechinus variegatus]